MTSLFIFSGYTLGEKGGMGGVLWGSQGVDDKLCLPAVFLPPSFSFPPSSECTPLEASQREASSFSRLNALATVNILSPAPAWDEQTDTNHCVDVMGRGDKKGVKDMLCFFSPPPPPAASYDEKY